MSLPPGLNWAAVEAQKLALQRDVFSTLFTYSPQASAPFSIAGRKIDPRMLDFEVQPQYIVLWLVKADFDNAPSGAVTPANGDAFVFAGENCVVVDVRRRSNGAIYVIGDKQ